MGTISDWLKDIPISEVLKERVALAEDRLEAKAEENDQLREENEQLRQRVAKLEQELSSHHTQAPNEPELILSEEATKALLYLFERTPGEFYAEHLAVEFGLKHSKAEYHLKKLEEAGLVQPSYYVNQPARWTISSEGQSYVIENGLDE